MGRCFRCKTEFSSGMLHHGHEYCVTCFMRITHEEEAKKRHAENMRRMREEARKKAATEITHRPKAAERAVPEKKLPAKPKPSLRRYGHISSTHAHPSLPNLPSRAPAHGMGWSKVNQVAFAAPKHAPLKKTEASHAGRGFGAFSSPSVSSPRLKLDSAEGIPSSLSRGQQVIITFKGLNLASRPSSVTLEVSIADKSGRKVEAKEEPKKCTLEAVGEKKFKVFFTVPVNAEKGTLKLTAQLHENAYHIDPAMGKSGKLELTAEIK